MFVNVGLPSDIAFCMSRNHFLLSSFCAAPSCSPIKFDSSCSMSVRSITCRSNSYCNSTMFYFRDTLSATDLGLELVHVNVGIFATHPQYTILCETRLKFVAQYFEKPLLFTTIFRLVHAGIRHCRISFAALPICTLVCKLSLLGRALGMLA